MIAICVCRHRLCAECSRVGNPSYHGKHRDPVFGNRGIYVVIIFIWIWSLVVIIGDVVGITGVYKFTNTIYGCNVAYDTNNTSYGMIVNILGNLFVILVAYSIVSRRLILDQREARCTMRNSSNNMFTKHIKMLVSLSIAYTVSVMPASVLSWGIFNLKYLDKDILRPLQAIASCLYLCMYSK